MSCDDDVLVVDALTSPLPQYLKKLDIHIHTYIYRERDATRVRVRSRMDSTSLPASGRSLV